MKFIKEFEFFESVYSNFTDVVSVINRDVFLVYINFSINGDRKKLIGMHLNELNTSSDNSTNQRILDLFEHKTNFTYQYEVEFQSIKSQFISSNSLLSIPNLGDFALNITKEIKKDKFITENDTKYEILNNQEQFIQFKFKIKSNKLLITDANEYAYQVIHNNKKNPLSGLELNSYLFEVDFNFITNYFKNNTNNQSNNKTSYSENYSSNHTFIRSIDGNIYSSEYSINILNDFQNQKLYDLQNLLKTSKIISSGELNSLLENLEFEILLNDNEILNSIKSELISVYSNLNLIYNNLGKLICLLDNDNNLIYENNLFNLFFNLKGQKTFDVVSYFHSNHKLLLKYENQNGFLDLINNKTVQHIYEFELLSNDHLNNSVKFVELKQQDISIANQDYKLIIINDITTSKITNIGYSQKNRFKELMDNMPLMIHSLNENNEIIEISKFFAHKLGYSETEILGKHTYDFMTNESREFALKNIVPEYFKDKNTNHSEYTFITKNGNTFEVLMTWVILKDELGNKRSLAISIDITELKDLYKQVKLNSELLDSIFENSPLGIEVLDLFGNKIKVNQKIKDLSEKFGYEIIYEAEKNQLMASMNLQNEVMRALNGENVVIEHKEIDFTPFSKFDTSTGNKLIGIYDLYINPLKNENNQVTNLICFIDDRTKQEKYHHELEFQSLVLKNVNDIVIALDENLKIIYWNDVATSVYGFDAKQTIGKLIEEFYSYRWIKEQDAQTSLNEVLTKGFWRGEIIHITKDNKEIYIETNTTNIIDSKGEFKGILAVNRDITSRKAIEQKVDQNLRMMNAMSEIANIGAWELDTINNNLLWSDQVYKIHGLSVGELIEVENAIDFYVDDSKTLISKVLNDAINEKISYNLVLRFKDNFGVLKWVRSSGYPLLENDKVVKVYGSFQDITNTYEKEKKIRENESLLKSINANVDEAIYRKSLNKGMIYINQAGLDMFGFKDIYEINEFGINNLYVDPYIIDKLYKQINQLGHFTKVEVEFRRKNGTTFWGLNSATKGFDEQGNEIFDGAIVDISDRKKKEELVNKLNQNLEQMVEERTHELRVAQDKLMESINKEKEYLELKSKFITLVSHEYRTPLTIVQTSTYLLEKFFENNKKEQFYKQLDKINNAIESMTVLLDNVLTIGSYNINSAKRYLQNIDFVKLVHDNIEAQLQINKKTFEINSNTKLTSLIVNTDKTMVYQIINNLIENAMKYSGHSNLIEVKIEKVMNLDGEIDFDNSEIDKISEKEYIYRTQKYKYLKLTVKDYGIGISEENIAKLSIPFFRGDNVEQIRGLGLGLSISFSWTKILEGKLMFESKEQEYTKATLILPIDYKE